MWGGAFIKNAWQVASDAGHLAAVTKPIRESASKAVHAVFAKAKQAFETVWAKGYYVACAPQPDATHDIAVKRNSQPPMKGISYDSRRPRRPVRRFQDQIEKSIDIVHTWYSREGALRRWGNEDNNFNLGSYGTELSSGVSFSDDGTTVDVIKASIHAEAASLNLKGGLFNNTLEGSASGKVLAADGELSLGSEWTKKAKDIHVRAGASVDLLKGEVGGKINIPFFGHTLSLGGTAEGQIGASAEAQAGGGWTEKGGFYFGASAKVGAGLGGGLGFNIGFK